MRHQQQVQSKFCITKKTYLIYFLVVVVSNENESKTGQHKTTTDEPITEQYKSPKVDPEEILIQESKHNYQKGEVTENEIAERHTTNKSLTEPEETTTLGKTTQLKGLRQQIINQFQVNIKHPILRK